MKRLLKQIINCEKGQVLPVVIGLLLVGGLIITPGLNYTATTIKSHRIINESIRGIHAAEAGVEKVIWSAMNSQPIPDSLPEKINDMTVTMQTEVLGTYTLYFGEWVEVNVHADYLDITGDMVWDEGADAYRYTITVSRMPPAGSSIIHLEAVGVRLPPGYTYQAGSASLFPGNLSLSDDELDIVYDEFGAQMLNWVFDTPRPKITESEPVKTQTFYVTGEEDPEGDYGWVVASRTDIGEVGEITGGLYRITATALRPDNRAAARIIADALLDVDATYITSWQVFK